MIIHRDPVGSMDHFDGKIAQGIVGFEFALDSIAIAHEEDAMSKLAGGMDGAFHFRDRGFIAPHRIYSNGDHWLVGLFVTRWLFQ